MGYEYTSEKVINHTKISDYADSKGLRYVPIGKYGNRFYQYLYTKDYADVVVKPILEAAMNNKEEYRKELVAIYVGGSSTSSFSFYISVATDENWLNTEVKIKLEIYVLDYGEHYLCCKYLNPSALGKETAEEIEKFIEYMTTENKKVYSF